MQKILGTVVMLFLCCLWTLPDNAQAQEYRAERQRRPRGTIRVTNDWRDTVSITMWTHDGERIGDSWDINSGESAFLAIDGRRIKVRPHYKIKVGNDWGRVDVESVAEFHDGAWQANVRDIWRATHDRGDRGSRRGDDDRNPALPDWQR